MLLAKIYALRMTFGLTKWPDLVRQATLGVPDPNMLWTHANLPYRRLAASFLGTAMEASGQVGSWATTTSLPCMPLRLQLSVKAHTAVRNDTRLGS